MSDYISRSALINDLKKNFCTYPPAVKAAIERAPVVDVEIVKHGFWIKTKSKSSADFTCSACGYTFTDGDPEYECEYLGCPMCRAKMEVNK